MTEREKLIEVMAEAICEATNMNRVGRLELEAATAALTALEASGVRLVPDKPTEHMERQMVDLRAIQDNQGWKDTVDIYRTGVAASPYVPGSEG